MANNLTGSVWVLDTASTSTLVYSGHVKIRYLRWLPNAAADTLLVKDALGHLIVSYTAIAGGEPGAVFVDYGSGKWIDGFLLHTMNAGGVLYVDIM